MKESYQQMELGHPTNEKGSGFSVKEYCNQLSTHMIVSHAPSAERQSVHTAESIITSALAQGHIQTMTGGKFATKIGRLLPTITVQDAKSNAGPSQFRRNTLPLNALIGGSLSPEWCEWLMGFPIGWTNLEPLATDKSRSAQ